MATRRKADQVTLPDFTAAVERIVAGLARGARALLDKETLDEAAIRALAMDLRRIDATGVQ